MRDHLQSTAPGPVAPPPLDPARWEDTPAFRETFLLHYTKPDYNAALRALGAMLSNLALEAGGCPVFPSLPLPHTRHELAAAAGDLRHLQGFLTMVGEEQEDVDSHFPDEAEKIRLSRLAARLAPRVAKIAATLEEAVRQ